MPQATDQLLRRLDLPVARRLDGLLQGDYRNLARGEGLDLADLREYQFHDDVRRMDWNVTARLDTPYVREYQEDREIPVWLLLDMSPSMRFEGVSVSKHAVLAEFATLLCRLILGKGNQAGAMLFSGAVEETVPVRGGRRQLLRILSALNRTRAQAGVTDLAQVLAQAGHVIRRRSLVFVVSDFISPTGWKDALGRLALRHDVVAVRLTDPLEARLPDLGFLTFQDAESGEQLFVDTHDRGFRARFAQAAEQRDAALRADFQGAGVDVVELSTQDDVLDALTCFAQLRRQSLRRPA